MLTVLVDHNIEGQATLLWQTILTEKWTELLPMQFVTFSEVNLPIDSNDRQVWRFAQANRMLLLTDNRSLNDTDSLEQTLREENTPTSLPVLTIGNKRRVGERLYREQCANRLVDIGLDLANYLGQRRIFIP